MGTITKKGLFINVQHTGSTELFTLVDSEGNEINEEGQLGLLLYKGGTVCDDSFDGLAAAAICKKMNFTGGASWTSEESFEIQSSYNINLDDVACESGEWESCTFTEEANCAHSEDVFLSCGEKRGLEFPIVRQTSLSAISLPMLLL